MGSLATFKTTYLASTVLPTGQREQVAGLIYKIEDHVARGASVPTAAALVDNARAKRVMHDAQAASTPLQFNMVADYVAISAP